MSYGAAGELTQTDTDPASIISHGRRAFTLATQLADGVDAQNRASDIIRTQSEPRYAVQAIEVLVETLTDPTRANLLDVISGSKVSIDQLPQPAPIDDFIGVCEGWTQTFTPGLDRIVLSLSDPRFSYQVVTWNEVDPVLTWGDVNATVQWYNVVSAGDLLA